MFRRGERMLLSGKREEEWTPEDAAAVRALPPPSVRRTALLATGLLVLLALEVGVLATLPARGSTGRAKQKRTMADLRSAMTAVEAYAAREGAYPPTSSMDELAKLLEPASIERLPRTDAWGHPIRYEAWKANDGSAGPDSYVLASPGKDGAWQVADPRTVAPGPTRGGKADLVIRDGEFVSYPEGTGSPTTR
jgi:type II secretory pathway pseudopilin PulG